MYIVEHILGNTHDNAWKNTLRTATVDVLELDQWDAQKNRLRRATQHGRDIAVSLERGRFLRDGDILYWDAQTQEAVVCRIRLCDVMVINTHGLTHLSPAVIVERCVALGHALGNQHWPAVVRDEQIFVPLTVDKKVMDSVMRAHHVEGITYSFVPGANIVAELDAAQVRRLFGGTEQPFAGLHPHTHAVPQTPPHTAPDIHTHTPDVSFPHLHALAHTLDTPQHEHEHNHMVTHEHSIPHMHDHTHNFAHTPEHTAAPTTPGTHTPPQTPANGSEIHTQCSHKQSSHAPAPPLHTTASPARAVEQPSHTTPSPTHATVQASHTTTQNAHAIQPPISHTSGASASASGNAQRRRP